MANMLPRFCPTCGTSVAGSERFCPNCGATMDVGYSNPTALASNWESTTVPSSAPPPPPPGVYNSPSQQSFSSYPPPQSFSQQGLQQPPVYAQPMKDSSKSVLGQIGCGVGLIILLILVICGASGYFAWQLVRSNFRNPTTTTTTTTGSARTGNNTNSNSAGTPAPATTTQINQTVIYSGIDITILNVQQADGFSDDTSAGTNGVVRLNVKESNQTTKSPYFGYDDTLRLILSDKNVVAPVNFQKYTPPATGVMQENWWDFPVPVTIHVDRLTLRLGTDSEAQMEVPLTGKADLRMYQPKTVNPNVQTQYSGLKWTVTSATLSYSALAKQAGKGMRYATLALKVDNNTATTFRGYWGDYIRLKAGGTTGAPTTDSNFPLSFDAGSTRQNGTLYFLVPEASTSLTLILLAQPNASPPVSEATANFQIA